MRKTNKKLIKKRNPITFGGAIIMKKLKKMIILEIILVIIIFLLGVYIIFNTQPQQLPSTELFLKNTTIVGKITSLA